MDVPGDDPELSSNIRWMHPSHAGYSETSDAFSGRLFSTSHHSLSICLLSTDTNLGDSIS